MQVEHTNALMHAQKDKVKLINDYTEERDDRSSCDKEEKGKKAENGEITV